MENSKDQQRLYEGMYIFNVALSDENRQRILDKVVAGVVDKGGEVHKIFDQGRKKLAYPIQNKRDGYYFLLFFSISPKNVSSLWKEYRLNEEILRFMTLGVEQVPDKIEFQSLCTD